MTMKTFPPPPLRHGLPRPVAPPLAELGPPRGAGQHDLSPTASADPVSSLVMALIAILGITLAVVVLGAHGDAAPAPAQTGAPTRLLLHGR